MHFFKTPFNQIKFVLTFILFFSITIISGQNKEKYFEFYFFETSDCANQNPSKREIYRPSKYIAIFSPIFNGNRAELEKLFKDFRDKHFKEVKKYSHTYWACSIGPYSMKSNSKADAIKKRNDYIQKLKQKGYEVIIKSGKTEIKSLTNKISFSVALGKNKYFSGYIVDGYVTIKSKFVFYGYPYIVSNYEDLIITDISYKNSAWGYRASKSSKLKTYKLPYKVKSKPQINATYSVWTPRIVNPNPSKKEHYKIFTYPINRLVHITDNFEYKIADTYFKNFKHPEKSDNFFWEQSLLKNPKPSPMGTYTLSPIEIKSFSGSLKTEIEQLLERERRAK